MLIKMKFDNILLQQVLQEPFDSLLDTQLCEYGYSMPLCGEDEIQANKVI